MDNEDSLEKQLDKAYEVFHDNLISGIIVSELKEDAIPSSIDISLMIKKKDIEKDFLHQGLVLIISSFECFYREFFQIIIDKDKNTRKKFCKIFKNKDLNIDILKVNDVAEGKISMGDIFSDSFSITKTSELKKLLGLINIEEEDLFEVNEDSIHAGFDEEWLLTSGIKDFNFSKIDRAIKIRNDFIHKRKHDIDLDNDFIDHLALMMQVMAVKVIEGFLRRKKTYPAFFRKDWARSEPSKEKEEIPLNKDAKDSSLNH